MNRCYEGYGHDKFFTTFVRIKCISMLGKRYFLSISCFFLFFFTCFFINAQSGFIVKGVVIDSITGLPLNAATIKIDGGYHTALSNSKGFFQLPTKQQNPTIHVSSMGYNEKSITLNLIESSKEEVTILLASKSVELEEVVTRYVKKKYVKKNNPAVELIKKVIDKKDELRSDNLPYFQCEKYERKSLALKDFSPNIKIKGYDFLHDYTDVSKIDESPILWLSVKEKASDVYYRKKPKTNKEIVKGTHRVGIDESFNQDGIETILSEIFTDVNIFDNDINYLMTRFVSPLSTNMATAFYKYYIIDTIQINNKPYINLEFVPFNTQGFGFTGRMYIANDSTYSIKKIQLDIPKEIQLNYVDNLQIEQEFEQQKNGAWMLVSEKMILDFSLIKSINGFYAEISRTYSDFSFSEAPKEVYDLPETSSVSPIAEQYPIALWQKHRERGMSQKEKDLSNMMVELHKKQSFNLAGVLFDLISTGYTPINSKIEIGKIASLASLNDVEDWRFRFDFRTTVGFHDRWYLAGYGAYGTRDKKFKYFGDLRYSFNKRKNYIEEFPMKNLGVSYKYDLELPGQFALMTNKDNIFMSINRNSTDDKMTYVRQMSVFYEQEFPNDFSYEIRAEHRNDEPTGSLRYLKQSGNDIVSINDMTTTTLGIRLRYAPGQKFYQHTGKRVRVSRDAPIFSITQKIGLENALGADYHIHSTEFSAKKRIWLSSFGNIIADVNAGKIWNEVPYPLLFVPNANTSYFLSVNTFSMMNMMEFINDEYLSLFLTYHVNGWIFNRLPLIKYLKLREVFAFRSVWSSLNDKNNPVINPNVFLFPMDKDGNTVSSKMDNRPYMEAVFGIENIFRIFRIDYVMRLSYLDKPNINKHGFQIGLNLVF